MHIMLNATAPQGQPALEESSPQFCLFRSDYHERDFEMIVRIFPEEIFAGADSSRPEGIIRESVDASGDDRRSHGMAVPLHGSIQYIPIACVKLLGFVIVTASPNGSDSMNDVFCIQLESRCHNAGAGSAGAVFGTGIFHGPIAGGRKNSP